MERAHNHRDQLARVSKLESGSKRVSVVELIELGAALKFDPAAALRPI
jgi:hypothetical protein